MQIFLVIDVSPSVWKQDNGTVEDETRVRPNKLLLGYYIVITKVPTYLGSDSKIFYVR
jgi:hypothetical protein